MTAIIANKVLKANNLTWDTPIVQFYESFKLPGDDRTKRVTFKDLYAHETCVSRSDFWWASGPEKFDIEAMMSNLQFLESKCEFRSKFLYNNLMYVAGSHIIETLANKTWDELIKEHILDPLEMTATKTSFKAALETRNVPRGFEPFEGEFHPLQVEADGIIDLVGQAGSIHSTAGDMNKYLRHIIENNGSLYADLFWDQETVDIGRYFGVTEKITRKTFPAQSEMSDYTISWVKGAYDGEEVIAHGGDTFTTHTFITLSRAREYGIFSSSTGGLKARAVNQLITWFIQDMIMDKTPWITAENICTFPAPWRNATTPDRSDPDWGDYETDTSPKLKPWAGTYSNKIFGDVAVSFVEDEGLVLKYQRVYCTLKRKKDSENEFRCHANAPSLPENQSLVQDARILNARFKDGNLHSDMMERNEDYLFSSGNTSKLYSFYLLILPFLLANLP
ncbi:hypothetical protein ACHWQZ_G001349 [Mnemiopsis leidyi]